MAAVVLIPMKISPEQEGLSIEDFLLKTKELGPRTAVKRAFLEKKILINGRAAKRQDLLKTNDVVTVTADDLFTRAQLVVQSAPELSLEILAESSDLVVINKPAGQNAHPLNPNERDTALNALAAHFPEVAHSYAIDKPLEGGLVHRLDRGTSGILLCARTPQTWAALREALRSREIVKIYAAWVDGKIQSAGAYECFLFHDPKSKKRMSVSSEQPRSQNAWWTRTSITPVQTAEKDGRPVTFVLIRIHTGVTHQIRAVLAALGHPVLGDEIYSAPRPTPLERLPLDTETQKHFEDLRRTMTTIHPPNSATLPASAFFLHALYLRSQAHPLLAREIFTRLPAYFMVST